MPNIQKSQALKVDMLNGSLLDKIILYALPLAASSVLQQLFNAVDIAVVGKFASSTALAAVGSNSSVINLIVTLFVGLSVGANVLIANYIGKKNRLGMKKAVATISAVALLSGVALLILGEILARPILEFIDTPDSIIDLSTLYLRIYFVGIPFIMIFNFGAAILRGMGDTKRPLYCLIFSGAINAVINVILVCGFHLDVAGVGIATVIANIINASLVIWILLRERNPYRLVIRRIGIYREELKRIVTIGLPAGIQGMVFAISNVTIQSSINSFGPFAVAGSAAALNFEHICYFLINAFANAAVTFMGQNIAAGKRDRCRRIYFHTMWLSIVFCGVSNVVLTWQEANVIKLFSDEVDIYSFAFTRMEWVLCWQFVACSYEVSGGALRGLGHSTLPAMMTVIGTCVLRLLWVAEVVPSHHSFNWLMAVYPVSWVVTGTMVVIAYFVVAHKKGIY